MSTTSIRWLLLITLMLVVAASLFTPGEARAALDSRSCPPGYTLDGIMCRPPAATNGGAATGRSIRAVDIDALPAGQTGGCDTAAGQRAGIVGITANGGPQRGCLNADGTPATNAIGGGVRASTVDQKVSCAFGLRNAGDYVNPVCWVRVFFASVGSFFMWLGVKAVVLAGGLFDSVTTLAIVNFGTTLSHLKSGIDTGWAAIRDIANIVIIGMFVFIAINIILGVKDFGDKKKIARVLIVAVLINFSLLFSKAIIDASNFTAYQFYNSMTKQVGTQTVSLNAPGGFSSAAGTSAPVDSSTIKGIAGTFLKLMGIQGIADSYNFIRAAQENQRSALIGLGYAFLMLLLLLGTALVFIYGIYLIVTRAVLLIFVMLTSALAFASWLIPHSFIEEGWTKWWKTLLKSAFFAPILMALLWATVLISTALVDSSQSGGGYAAGGSLGKLAENATGPGNLGVLFNYFLILGLLFASFKVSSTLASSITGFNAIGAGIKNLAVGVPALAWRFGVAPLARQTIGMGAYFGQKSIIKEGKGFRTSAGLARAEAESLRLKGQHDEALAKEKEALALDEKAGGRAVWAGRVGRIAGASFNLGDAGTAKQLTKALGISGLVAGQRPKDVPQGYEQGIKEKIKLGEERAKAIDVSGAEKEQIRNTAREEAYRAKASEHKKHEDNVKKAEQEQSDAPAKHGEKVAAKEAAQSEHDAVMRGENVNISRAQAQANLAAAERQVKESQEIIDGEKLKQAQSDLTKFHERTESEARKSAQRTISAVELGAAEAARVVGRKMAGIVNKATGVSGHIGDEVRDSFRARQGTKGIQAALAQTMKEAETPGAAPAASAPEASPTT